MFSLLHCMGCIPFGDNLASDCHDDGPVVTRDMMTSSNGSIFRATGPLCGEFIGHGEFSSQRPVTRSFDVFFDVRLE